MINQTKPYLTRPARTSVSTYLIYILCIILALVFLFPVVWSGLNSIKPPDEAAAVPPTYLPSYLSLDKTISSLTILELGCLNIFQIA